MAAFFKSLRLIAGIFLLSAAAGSIHAVEKKYPDLPFASDYGGPFDLIDHTGQPMTDQSFHGRYVILYFGYTNCADTCPLALSTITHALTQMGPLADDVTPVLINLDPGAGTLAALEEYVHYFHPRMIGLTGSERALAAAAGGYGIRYRYAKNEDGSTLMIHSGKIFFIGPNGDVLTYFPHEATSDWLATTMSRYVRTGEGIN